MANSFVVGMFDTSLIGFSGNARGVPAESTTLGFDSTATAIIPLPSGPVQGRCLPGSGTANCTTTACRGGNDRARLVRSGDYPLNEDFRIRECRTPMPPAEDPWGVFHQTPGKSFGLSCRRN